MAYQSLAGVGPWMPSPPPVFSSFTFLSTTINATGQKIAWSGRVWTPDRSSKSVRKVHFLFGTVTKTGGSGLTVSLQDVSTAAGLPVQPDETQDQTVAIANGDTGFTSNAWYTTGALSADRSVSYGDALSVVVEYDGSGRLGSDTVSFRNPNRTFGGEAMNFPGVSLKSGGTWAKQNGCPNLLLEFSDGTFGVLYGSFPCSAISSLQFKQDTAGSDEYAIDITPPINCKVEGLWAFIGVQATTADFDFVLYSGTSAMTGGTVSHDGTWVQVTGQEQLVEVPFTQEITLTAGQSYKLALKPTQTTSNCRLAYFDVNASGHMAVHSMGTAALINSRIDLGSWAGTTSTRRPLMGLKVSALDDGAGSSGAPSFGRGSLFRTGA